MIHIVMNDGQLCNWVGDEGIGVRVSHWMIYFPSSRHGARPPCHLKADEIHPISATSKGGGIFILTERTCQLDSCTMDERVYHTAKNFLNENDEEEGMTGR
jgi:hypothetical protein